MKYLIVGLTVLCLPMLLLAPIIGLLADPWAPWRLSGHVGDIPVGGPVVADPIDPASMPVVAGGVTDAFRYQLARAAGWSVAEAIIATAISIAEDPAGNPVALSGRNSNGSFDFCLWQVNSQWWAQFGGQQALADPQICAGAAHVIYGLQGWGAWSAYNNNAYRSYLSRAQAAADVPLIGV